MSVSRMFRPKNRGSRTMFLSSLMCQNIFAAYVSSRNQCSIHARSAAASYPEPRACEPSRCRYGREGATSKTRDRTPRDDREVRSIEGGASVSDDGWFPPPTGVSQRRSRSNDASPDCSHAGSGIEPYGHFSLRFSFRLTRTEEKGHLSNVQAALSLARALVFGVASDAMAQQAMYEQMVFPTRFVWGYGGKQVRARPPTLAEFHASQIFSPPRVARPVRPAAPFPTIPIPARVPDDPVRD